MIERGDIVTICLKKFKVETPCVVHISRDRRDARDELLEKGRWDTRTGVSLNYCTLFDGNRKGVRRVMFKML